MARLSLLDGKEHTVKEYPSTCDVQAPIDNINSITEPF